MHAIYFLFHASSRWIWNQNCGSHQQQLWVHLWGWWICCYIVARLDPLATDHSNIVPHYSLFSVLRWSSSWRTSRVGCLNLPHCSGHSVLHHSTLWHCFCYCLPCFQHYIQEQKVIMTCLRSVNKYWQTVTLGTLLQGCATVKSKVELLDYCRISDTVHHSIPRCLPKQYKQSARRWSFMWCKPFYYQYLFVVLYVIHWVVFLHTCRLRMLLGLVCRCVLARYKAKCFVSFISFVIHRLQRR